MGKVENAVQWAIAIAHDNSHGYSQSNRWGPHYDCSSFLITAYEQAGVPVKINGAGYTGDMYNAFIKSGFTNMKSQVNISTGSGLIRGDVLLIPGNHTVMYIGNGQIVHASSPTNGILVQNYYSDSWTYVLRLIEKEVLPVRNIQPGLARTYIACNIYNTSSLTGVVRSLAKGAQVRVLDSGTKVVQVQTSISGTLYKGYMSCNDLLPEFYENDLVQLVEPVTITFTKGSQFRVTQEGYVTVVGKTTTSKTLDCTKLEKA